MEVENLSIFFLPFLHIEYLWKKRHEKHPLGELIKYRESERQSF